MLLIMLAQFNSSVPVSKDSEQHQDPETEVHTWNEAIVNLVIYTYAFPTVTSKSVFHEKDPSANNFHILCPTNLSFGYQ